MEVQQTFPNRLKIYEAHSSGILDKEESYMHQMIDSYLKLKEPSDPDKSMEEFYNFGDITDQFMDYLKREDQKLTSSTLFPETHKRQEEEIAAKIYSIFKELKAYDTERLKRLGALFTDKDSKPSKWTEVETANLLRGIFKHGENNWRTILAEEQFEKGRTVNQLVLKWRMIKIFMKGELDAMNIKRQKLITRNDWIIAAIKGLEKRNNIHREPLTNLYHPYVSPYYKHNDRHSEELGNSAGAVSCRGLKRSQSQLEPSYNIPLFSI